MLEGLPFSSIAGDILIYVYISFVIIAPFILGYVFFNSFVTWKRNKFISEQKKVMIEVRLPKEVVKSPMAMELFLTALSQTKGEGTWISKYLKGKVRPWFSLEIASFGGDVRFFIWMWEFWKPLIESALYAQYPEIEIKEVPDYAQKIEFNEEIDLWSTCFGLDKADYYPIKTYVEYKMDKDPDEELKVDPMTPLLEFMGALRAGEQSWIQILVRAHKKEKKDPNKLFKKVDWTHGAKEEIKKLKTADKKQIGDIEVSGLSMTQSDKESISAIQRNISKLPFDVGIRVIYLARKENFSDINVAALNGSFKQYNAHEFNSFKSDKKHTTDFDYPWQDISGKRLHHRKLHAIHGYQNREYFHRPSKGHFFTMNVEGLATIYHFPGQVAKTPTLSRVSAKKSEPPSNLPM